MTSIKDLLKIAKEDLAPNELPKDPNGHLEETQRFVLAFEIKDGKNKVQPGLLYDAYYKWTNKPVGKMTFFRQFAKLFVKKKESTNNFYLLNIKPMDLVNKAEELRRKDEEEI